MTAASLGSGKGRRDENFPVASFLIHRRHRPIIHAFYRFARAADDVADHPKASPEDKLRLLEDMRASLAGNSNAAPEAVDLRAQLNARGLTAQHGFDLLEAFRRDVTKSRYADWADLMDYCRYSAMPVGRFVLDVHGESRDTWPKSDALCAALQVINHLQDCGKDYRNLDRVYVPLDSLSRAGIAPAMLASPKSPLALRGVIEELVARTAELLQSSKGFALQIRDTRLAVEVNIIQALAKDLTRRLARRDPLCERVHHSKGEAFRIAVAATARFLIVRRRPNGIPVAATRSS
ncbi:MAG TPA: squalene synthase HpnC [Rhizomicrobium sp.]|jgi:squalene synthase HpnC|nr:squalene synthase HpnC [Rhizomicrobium sp.]